MKIEGATALVTGANRGLGERFVATLRERGAARIYAAARNPESIEASDTIVPLRLDVTNPTHVAEVAAAASDVTLLVNNAGTNTRTSLLDGDLADVRLEIETHLFGALATIRAFAPALERSGGAVLNVLSVRSWIANADEGAYAVAKSAAWAMTNSVRLALAPRGVLVSALHVGYMDTEMVSNVSAPKSDPAVIAGLALDGIGQGRHEIVADERSRMVRAKLSGELHELYPDLVAARR
jgi:NAD(P)-dependent dehydrogenase (short-subunit alcohol dehydrogenase family)